MRTLAVLSLLTGLAAAQEIKVVEQPGAFLGVSLAPLDEETRGRFKIPQEVAAGVVLMQVVKGSPAEAAGFRAGDVLTSFDNKALGSLEDLLAAVGARKPGDQVAYVIRRGTGTIEGNVTLARREERRIELVPFDPRPPVPAEEPAPERPEKLERRLDRLDRDLEELRRRILRAAPLRHPRSLGAWIHREEQLAGAARKQNDPEKYRYHTIRLSVLREMQEAEVRLPAGRLERIENKLDQILERLNRMR
ncbi:MAG: S1C family serine protease [Planctomycetota bacterium]|jgi:hypothetical protein